MDVVTKDVVSENLVSDPVNHVATQEVAQVKGRSGGSAKVKVKRREPEFVVLTCCSRFPMFAGCFTLEVL